MRESDVSKGHDEERVWRWCEERGVGERERRVRKGQAREMEVIIVGVFVVVMVREVR